MMVRLFVGLLLAVLAFVPPVIAQASKDWVTGFPREQIAVGLGASPGAATGEIAFTAEEAEKLAADNHDVILVRTETSPEDIHGMHAARGILTARGGMTSHAAVVARGMGKCCVAGCSEITVDYDQEQMRVKGYVLKKAEETKFSGDGELGKKVTGSDNEQ